MQHDAPFRSTTCPILLPRRPTPAIQESWYKLYPLLYPPPFQYLTTSCCQITPTSQHSRSSQVGKCSLICDSSCQPLGFPPPALPTKPNAWQMHGREPRIQIFWIPHPRAVYRCHFWPVPFSILDPIPISRIFEVVFSGVFYFRDE